MRLNHIRFLMLFRTYSELLGYETWDDRVSYLMLRGQVGNETFGSMRGLNQAFYKSADWLRVREEVLARDHGCDLGLLDFPILFEKIFIHHMNPITPEMLLHRDYECINPDGLITVSYGTHQIIHFSKSIPSNVYYKPRESGDTKLW